MTGPVITDAATVPLSGGPLLVLDADEVLFRFVDGLMRFLDGEGLYLDLTSYRLHGNVKRRADDAILEHDAVSALLDRFREDLDSLAAVGGARAALETLSPRMDIVVLSNVSPSHAEPRRRNLIAAGLPFPLIPNAGLKGPALRQLSGRATRTFFVDDIPSHLASAAEEAPDVLRIHFIGDARLKPLLPPSPHAHLRAESWAEIARFITDRLEN